TTTGYVVQAANIEVKGEFGWSSANTLFLDAFQSITVGRVISIAGTGGLVLRTKDGGSGGALTFVRKGHAVFHNLASQLTINGILYTLENGLPSLANAIA